MPLNKVVIVKSDQDVTHVLEQYKVLADSINKHNEVRENANNFWTSINALGISSVAYIRDKESIISFHKSTLIWVVAIVGVFICLAWLNYLKNIKTNIDARNKLLATLETHLPAKIFTSLTSYARGKPIKGSLTLKEMAVPLAFLMGYSFFIITLLFFSHEATGEGLQQN